MKKETERKRKEKDMKRERESVVYFDKQMGSLWHPVDWLKSFWHFNIFSVLIIKKGGKNTQKDLETH